ncbi:unnamed protein product [Spodoptera exigua]|nr:unnamed protein product [Spodoptera exigua]
MYAVLFIVLTTVIIFALSLGLYQKSKNAVCTSRRRLDGKTVIVTGGTAGMGLHIATDLAHRGARVIVACPFKDEGTNARKQIVKETGNENVVYKHLDLGSLQSVRQFAADILKNEDRLDVLLNNAGVGIPGDFLTSDGMNFIMQVNYYGTFLLTLLLIPLLKKTGKPGEASRIITTAPLGKVHRLLYMLRWMMKPDEIQNKPESAFTHNYMSSNVSKNNTSIPPPAALPTRVVLSTVEQFPWFGVILQQEERMEALQILGRDALKNDNGLFPAWQGNYLYTMIVDPEAADLVLRTCLEKDDIMQMATLFVGNGSIFAPESTLGYKMDAQKSSDHPFLKAFNYGLPKCAERLCQPWLHSDLIYKNLPVYTRLVKLKEYLWNFMIELIKAKRKEIKHNKPNKDTERVAREALGVFISFLTQSLIAYGSFGKYSFQRDEPLGDRYFKVYPENTIIGSRNLSRLVLVQAMMRNKRKWEVLVV